MVQRVVVQRVVSSNAHSRRVLAALVIVSSSLSACTTLRDSTGIQAPEPLGKTATGAVTGAAVGGGLGLLVGSASGNAGEGLLVGSLAGSALGAGIGAKLEREDQRASLESSQSTVRGQSSVIEQQNRHLQQLRNDASDAGGSQSGLSDNVPTFNSSQLGEDLSAPRTKPMAPNAGRKKNTLTSTDIAPPSASLSPVTTPPTPMKKSPAPKLDESGITDTRRGQLRSPRSVVDSGGPEYLNRPSGLRKASPYRPGLERASLTEETGNSGAAGRAAIDESPPVAAPTSKSIARSELRASSKPQGRIKDTPTAAAQTLGKSHSPESKPVAEAKPALVNSGLPPAAVADVSKNTELADAKADGGKLSGNQSGSKPPGEQSECKEALKEAERGLHATSEADRLFYLRRAARLCPSEPSYHVELGKVYSSLGKNDDAKFEFRQAIDLDPNNEIARDELSIVENTGNISR